MHKISFLSTALLWSGALLAGAALVVPAQALPAQITLPSVPSGKFLVANETFKTTFKNREIEGVADFRTRNLQSYAGEWAFFNQRLWLGLSGKTHEFRYLEPQEQKYWAGVKLPAFADHHLTLKGTYEKLFLYPLVELEADVQRWHGPFEYGFNSHLKYKRDEYPTPALTVKGFVQKSWGKFEDVRVELEGQHRLNSINGNLASSPYANGVIKRMGLQYLSSEVSTRYALTRNLDLYWESNFAYRWDNNTSKYGKDVQINRGGSSSHGHDHDHGHEHNHDHSHSHSHAEAGVSSPFPSSILLESDEDGFLRGFNHVHGYKDANVGLEAKLDRENFSEEVADYHLLAFKYNWRDLEVVGKYKFYHRFRHNEVSPDFPEVPATTHTFTNYGGLQFKYTLWDSLTLTNKTEAYLLTQTQSSTKNRTLENHTEIKYDWRIGDRVTLTPSLAGELIIDGTEYFSEELQEMGINGGFYRDFTNSAAVIPAVTVKYQFNKNLYLLGYAGMKVNFAGVHPEIYNPKFLAVDALISELATANGYPNSGEKFNEFLGKLANNEILVADSDKLGMLSGIYESLNGEPLAREDSGVGLLDSYVALLYETKIKDPAYFGKVLPLKKNTVNYKFGVELKYVW